MSLLAVGKLKTLVANTAKWQSLTGAANATAALAFIYEYGGNTAANAPAMFLTNQTAELERIATNQFHQSGTIAVRLQLARRSAASLQAEYLLVQADVDTLLAEITALQGTGTYLMIRRMVMDFVGASDPRVAPGQQRWEWRGTVEWP